MQKKQVTYFKVQDTCNFDKCGLSNLKGKKWESVEDAGIILCTKAPKEVDCLKYNMEFRKLMHLKRDLQYEGIEVDL